LLAAKNLTATKKCEPGHIPAHRHVCDRLSNFAARKSVEPPATLDFGSQPIWRVHGNRKNNSRLRKFLVRPVVRGRKVNTF
jgi:hypothetical protein